MKISRYVIVFSLLAALYFVVLDHSVNTFNLMSETKARLNKAIDASIDAAMRGIVENADGDEVTIDFDACIDNFYTTLYAAFGAIDSETSQTKLNLYTPILAIADVDGLYVYYSDIIQERMQRVWSQKIPYSFTGSCTDDRGVIYSYTIIFTLTDEVKINVYQVSEQSVSDAVDPQTIYSGDYTSLRQKYPVDAGYTALNKVLDHGIISTYGDYCNWKTKIITDTITEQLNYYVNRHNRIADFYGEQFSFSLPESAQSTIARSISDVSFMCFFQGYPYGVGSADTYSNFEISGARVSKKSEYYVRRVDGYLYYHRKECKKGGENSSELFYSMKECAETGAIPCPYCRP